MGSVTKRNHPLALPTDERGQISIFFSASLVVLITIIAFVINVGLFVKAKINLQNATDAAAFSGAAVQARQLTKIAYLNWEMRNIYKEWLYKMYVIGNLNTDDVRNPAVTGAMDYRLKDDIDAIVTSRRFSDPYNFPAVCLHLAGHETNVCRRYSMPGLPEFGGYQLTGAEEASRVFQDLLINTKVHDCLDRTRLNMLTALSWAYNVISDPNANTVGNQALAVLSDKQGAWPKAVELAIRMRNLEYVVNREPESNGVCFESPNHPGIRCGRQIDEIEREKKLGNERIVKAFYAGYRNLGNDRDDRMKRSFTLTELAPNKTPVSRDGLGGIESASYLLIPRDNLGANYHKQFLDLKLMAVNYATFYAALMPDRSPDRSGACHVSKIAIPVPGYPLGFYKNPDVVTYYAIKGEAEFVGMFNPFNTDTVKLTAYAAAKPFGGRIGPMLFHQQDGDTFITGRKDTLKRRSVPYISSIEIAGAIYRNENNQPATLPLGVYRPGVILPINFGQDPGYFWLKEPNSPVGGRPSGDDIQFGLPNMVYDYQERFMPSGYQHRDDFIHKIDASRPSSADKEVGLFSRYQLRKFKGENLIGEIGPDQLQQAIYRAKAPTLYETANYMIPFPAQEFQGSPVLDSFGFLPGPPNASKSSNGVRVYETSVYAPLYKDNDQVDVLFQNASEVKSAIFDLMRFQESGMKKYLKSLNLAAKSLYDEAARVTGAQRDTANSYRAGARKISDVQNFQGTREEVMAMRPLSCSSMAGQFMHFYYGHQHLRIGMEPDVTPDCPMTLGQQLENYFAGRNNFDPNYYTMEVSWTNEVPSPFTAYRPGPFTGVDQGGIFQNIVSGSNIQEAMRRNFYSTKFIPLNSLTGGAGFTEIQGVPIISEGDSTPRTMETRQQAFKNSLDAQAANLDLGSIKH
jgi:hypothetical protein